MLVPSVQCQFGPNQVDSSREYVISGKGIECISVARQDDSTLFKQKHSISIIIGQLQSFFVIISHNLIQVNTL